MGAVQYMVSLMDAVGAIVDCGGTAVRREDSSEAVRTEQEDGSERNS